MTLPATMVPFEDASRIADAISWFDADAVCGRAGNKKGGRADGAVEAGGSHIVVASFATEQVSAVFLCFALLLLCFLTIAFGVTVWYCGPKRSCAQLACDMTARRCLGH